MSAILTGAVFSCGPSKGTLRLTLVAITDNSDDYGFACPSIATIAVKACCDERTAMRHVQALERDGWLTVRRKVLHGKANVYFVNIAKLGIVANPKMRRSQLHVEVTNHLAKKEIGDNLSREFIRAAEKSGDNPQGSQVTKLADSRDKRPFAILKNRKEPLLNFNTPQPPSSARGVRLNVEADDLPNATVLERAALLEERSACAAVEYVMRECNVTDRRVASEIKRALRLYCKKSGEDYLEIAETMASAQRQFLASSHLMSYTIGIKKFFGHGFWQDQRKWPWHQEKVNQARRL